jgi:DNA-binding CsgD family transcriptional regulator
MHLDYSKISKMQIAWLMKSVQHIVNTASKMALDVWQQRCAESEKAFHERVFDVLSDHVPFDAVTWCYVRLSEDGRTLKPHTTFLRGVPDNTPAHYLRLRARDTIMEECLAKPGTACLHDGDQPVCRLEPELEHFYREHGIHHLCRVAQVHELTGLRVILSLSRGLGKVPFRNLDGLLVEAVLPHLISALDDDRRHRLMRLAGFPGRSGGAALVDGFGLIHLADESFLELVKTQWPEWFGPKLPDALIAMSSSPLKFLHVKCAWHSLPGDPLRLLSAQPLAAVDVLTSRQMEIALAYADGKQHKVIAQELGLSPATVRNHLRTVYTTLHVRTKQELAKALAASAPLPLFPGTPLHLNAASG